MNEEIKASYNAPIMWEGPFPEKTGNRGRLKIFFGYAGGVGKTYAMLNEARELSKSGADVLVGYIEANTKPDTLMLLESLNLLPPKIVHTGGIQHKEFNLDEALKLKPQIILVDALAHENGEGMRNKKRYQDIEELLTAGIDVYTTVNVQYIESLKDLVQNITGELVSNTVPDYIFDGADMVKLIDLEPEELLRRFSDENTENTRTAEAGCNSAQCLRLLRELAIRKAADRISRFNSGTPTDEKRGGTRFLVCIGPSPSSAKCIRWTARAAVAFHAPWCAVYVEVMNDKVLGDEEKKRISSNIALAEEMGAEIVTLNGDDIASVIAGYAKMSGITNIVVGKSRNKKTLFSLFRPDFEDRLITMLPNVEVHIVPGNPPQASFRRPKRADILRNLTLSWPDTIKTMLYLFAATMISYGLKNFGVGEIGIITLYILSVLIISRTTAGFFYGVTASLVSVLAFNFFFTEPYYTLFTSDPNYPVVFLIMLVSALTTSATTVKIKNQAQIAVEREHRTGVLYEINKRLLVTRNLSKITDLTNEYLVNLFERPAIFYTSDPMKQEGTLATLPTEENSEYLNSEQERSAASWAFVNCKNAGAGTDTLADAAGFYMPIITQGRAIGVIGLGCKKKILTQGGRMLLQRIVSQVALALERQKLSVAQRAAQIESVREKTRANLLRSISHDLRTPLTSISGASSALLENGDSFDEASRRKLLLDIKEESLWLIRLVENILSITRINEGGAGINKSPEAAEEIMAEAVSRTRVRFPDVKISVSVPDELLIVPMDGTLIEQVLINLIENAVRHTGDNTEIKLSLRREGSEAIFEVTDNGEGIAEQDLPYIFESYSADNNKSADSSRGMGIGLSICMSIVKSHGGTMTAENRKEGGATFRFLLPLEESLKDGK